VKGIIKAIYYMEEDKP